MTTEWPFDDPTNVATFTSRQIISGDDWIYYVGHDEGDGAWQFHGKSGSCDGPDTVVVSLASVVKRDPSIRGLSDLPLGWCAWRDSPELEWRRAPQAK